jgi:putative DNA primase/helicase
MVAHTKAASTLKYALAYAKSGYKVIPIYGIVEGACACGAGAKCKNPGKHPMTSNGFKAGTTDPKQIKQWFADAPQANVAIVTGDGLVVVDVDEKHGGHKTFAELEENLGKLPRNAVVKTGGDGLHIYMRSKERIRNSSGKLGPGVDVRGDGGYIVAPPSRHISGKRYIWIQC